MKRRTFKSQPARLHALCSYLYPNRDRKCQRCPIRFQMEPKYGRSIKGCVAIACEAAAIIQHGDPKRWTDYLPEQD